MSSSINDPNERRVSEFLALLKPWESAYKFKRCSYIAVNTPDVSTLIYGLVVLQPKRDDKFPHIDFRSHTIVAGSTTSELGSGELDRIVNSAKQGKFIVAGNEFRIKQDNDQAPHFHSYPIYHPRISDGPRIPALIADGVSRHSLMASVTDERSLDWEIRANTSPFDGINDLLAAIGLPNLSVAADSTRLELVAWTPGFIVNKSKIRKRTATIICRVAAALDTKDVRIGYVAKPSKGVKRGFIAGEEMTWNRDEYYNEGRAKVLVGDVAAAQVFLSYGGETLDHSWIIDPDRKLNMNLAIHTSFDKDLSVLRELLFNSDGGDARAFEQGVSLLLTTLGFNVSHHGVIKKLQDGPDLVASTSNGSILVVECTTQLLNEKGKLGKLVSRTRRLAQHLHTSGYGDVPIRPIIVTALPRTQIQAGLDEAGRCDVAVACKEDLETFIKRAIFPPDSNRLFDETVQLIPQSGQGQFPI